MYAFVPKLIQSLTLFLLLAYHKNYRMQSVFRACFHFLFVRSTDLLSISFIYISSVNISKNLETVFRHCWTPNQK